MQPITLAISVFLALTWVYLGLLYSRCMDFLLCTLGYTFQDFNSTRCESMIVFKYREVATGSHIVPGILLYNEPKTVNVALNDAVTHCMFCGWFLLECSISSGNENMPWMNCGCKIIVSQPVA